MFLIDASSSITLNKMPGNQVHPKKEIYSKPKPYKSSRLLEYGELLTVLFSIFMLIAFVYRDLHSESRNGSLLPQTEASVVPAINQETREPEIYRKKISEIQIGEKAVGINPEGIEAGESDATIF